MTFKTNYVFALPPAPPPAPYVPWIRSVLEWIGWDGSVWNLSDWRSGVFAMYDGIEGLSRPTHTDWIAPMSPAMHGQQFNGFVVDPRKIFLPVFIYSDASSDAFQELDAAFWATMKPNRPGTLRFTSTAGTREIRARFRSDGGHSYIRDPHKAGWARYGIELIADDPFWTSESISQSWAQQEGRDFFGGPNSKAPMFYIGSGSQLASATISNPGDVDAWPIWTVTGPADGPRLGVGGRFVSAPFDVLEGQTLMINTDPTEQTAWLDGADVTHLLGEYSFAPIPPGEDRALGLSMSGAGSVHVMITPRHDRAW